MKVCLLPADDALEFGDARPGVRQRFGFGLLAAGPRRGRRNVRAARRVGRGVAPRRTRLPRPTWLRPSFAVQPSRSQRAIRRPPFVEQLAANAHGVGYRRQTLPGLNPSNHLNLEVRRKCTLRLI
jgi:hypothetical protein